MNSPEPIPTKAAILDLKAKVCACGARKVPRQTFCRAHYFALPIGMREALYNGLGRGYEEAYATALAYHRLSSPALSQEVTRG